MKVKYPQAAFEACPACRRRDLRVVSVATYCDACGWDSSAAFVDAGGLDQLIYEVEKLLGYRKAGRSYAARRSRELSRIAV